MTPSRPITARKIHGQAWLLVYWINLKKSINAGSLKKSERHNYSSQQQFLPDIFDAGIDIIDPIQPHVAAMNSADLKANFGDKLTFHCAIDIQQVLLFGTKEEIEREVRAHFNDLGKSGGYILASAHNVQAGVKPENIIYIIDAVKKFGLYSLKINIESTAAF